MTYRRGDFLVTCPVCGFDKYRSEMRKRWDGLTVCNQDWEPRQPQDTLKPRPEKVYTNTGLGEDSVSNPTYNSAIPFSASSGSGSYTSFTMTPTSSGFAASTANTFTLDSTIRYSSFKGLGTGDGGIYQVGFTYQTSVFAGVYIENNAGVFTYRIGVLGGDRTGDLPFTQYSAGDELAVGVSTAGTYGTVYFYLKGNLVNSYALTQAMANTPNKFTMYVGVMGASAPYTLVETPSYPINGATQYAQQLTLTYTSDEIGI